jgi:branched-chain amino acid transport system substrate-binding protein
MDGLRNALLNGVTRRRILGTAAGALCAPAILPSGAAASVRPVKIGLVAPRTGPLAGFAEADNFILDQFQKSVGAGLRINGQITPVQVVTRDSQSNPSRAAEVAADLILGEKVDLLLAASTPDTTNPVADQAEVNEVPCITNDCPWQAYFFGRKGDPKQGFKWTYHFFWGLEDVIASFVAMWDNLPTNKIVGGLFPNDADGNAWSDAQFGLPAMLPKAGYQVVNPGSFQPFTNDFTAQIAAFKKAGCEIVTGALTPPDFATFWAQARQQGFRPKIATVGKALLFPSAVAALGPAGDGVSSEIWWSPNHPFKSGLTGQSPGELCAAYSASTGRPWTQPIGFKHALLEVAADVLKRSASLEPEAILAAIKATDYQSIVGPVRWTGQPVPNVCRTPLVAGQWRLHDKGPELVIAENATYPAIPLGAPLQPLP